MSLLINYTTFIPRFIGIVCQRGIRSANGRIFSLRASPARYVRLNETLCRTAVSLAKEEPQWSNDVDDMVFRLSEDIRIRNVFFNDVMEVFSAVQKKGKITDSHFLLFMRCCSEISLLSTPAERVQFAENVWVACAKSGMKFTLSHFNALLNVFVECNHRFSSSQFLKNIRDKGLEPNVITLNKLLKAHCQRGDPVGANNILAEMKNMNLPLSANEFTSLIQCYAISGDFDKTIEILKLMEDRDIDPPAWAYTYLLCGYAMHGKIEELKKMLDELPNKCVKLSNLHLAEIVYSLVSNNFGAHIQIVLDKMTSNFSDNKLTLQVIHRLIREKYDSEAFQVFEKLNTMDITLDNVLTNSKLILKHFALYREPKDIIHAINVMKDKEWIKTGLSVVLRQIYKHKDEDFCIDFLTTMMKLKMKVGSHYFWPPLIKTLQKDNSKVREILQYINPKRLGDCQNTTTKILYLHYNFSDNWRNDFDVLYELGCPARWLSVTFIKVIAKKNNLKEAVNVAATYPVNCRRSSDIFKFLVDYIQENPDEVSDFVDILYYLNHDNYLENMKKKMDVERRGETAESNVTVGTAYENALFTLKRNLHNEEVAQKILENMIEKKVWISSKTIATFGVGMSKKFHELLEKLTNPEFKCEFDEDVLKRKTSWAPVVGNETDELKKNTKQQNVVSANPFVIVLQLSRMKDFIKLKKILPELKEEQREVQRALWRGINEWISKEQVNVAEELRNIAVDAGVFSDVDQINFIRRLIIKKALAEAVKNYAEYVAKTMTIPRYFELLITLAQKDDDTVFDSFCDIISPFLSKDRLFTSLIIAYTSAGKLEKARAVMENEFSFFTRILHKHIALKFSSISSETLESFWKVLKHKPEIDRVNLYKFLVRKYAEEKKLDKIKDLWLFIEEDDISNYKFLEQIRDLVDDPTLEALEKLAKTFEKEGKGRIVKIDQVLEI